MYYPELNKYSEILCLDGELWKPIFAFEDRFHVSNFGRVKRLEYSSMNRNQVCEWEQTYKTIIMKANPDSRGYPQVSLKFEGKKRVARIHRLVAESFLKPPSQEMIKESEKSSLDYVMVNHIDGNILNPSVHNLEWCTASHNMRNSHNKHKRIVKVSGQNNTMSKLSEKDVAEIIDILRSKTMSQDAIAALYGVKQITISNIWCGRSWSHFTGIKWKARTRKYSGGLPLAEQILNLETESEI